MSTNSATDAPATSLEEAYLILIRFLMLSKHRAIELGSDYGLTGMQTFMLLLLEKPRPMYSFKKVFNCDASNVTGLVDGLEQKDLASRFENPEDRRLKMVELDKRGREIRRAMLKKIAARDGPIFSRLTAEEFDDFIRLLQKITGEA
jgi:DNA-binding MarR family transcriptional regulator